MKKLLTNPTQEEDCMNMFSHRRNSLSQNTIREKCHHHMTAIALMFGGLSLLLTSSSFSQSEKKLSEGEKVWNEQGCATCHGADFKGTELGPALKRLKKNWKKNDLLIYMNGPGAYAEKNARLKKIGEKFTLMRMPDFDFLPKKQATDLVDFLIKK